jgi:hypothetical protein
MLWLKDAFSLFYYHHSSMKEGESFVNSKQTNLPAGKLIR